MKVTFLTPPPLDDKPPAERIYGCNYGLYQQPNIFVLGMVSLLEDEGFEVELRDYSLRKDGLKKFREFVNKNDFDIILFYAVFLSRTTDLAALDTLKEKKFIATIFMGQDPTIDPHLYLQNGSIVVRGEPEYTLLELLKTLEEGKDLDTVKGISYTVNGVQKDNPPRELIEDLDSLPFPARERISKDEYYNPKLRRRPMTVMLTSRGCSHRCWMCVPNSLSFAREVEWKRWHDKKPPVKIRSAENVVKEFTEIAKDGYKSVSIIDDEFVWGKKRTIEICEGIKDLGIEWGCLARADYLQDEEVIEAMAEANCVYVDIGVESFSQEILDYIKKDLKVESIYRAVRLLKKYGIQAKLNLLLGACPLETEETIKKNVEEVIKLDADGLMLSIATPFPCTEFHEKSKEEGWMTVPEYVPIDPSKESLISYPHLSKEKLEKLLWESKRKFYLRPSYILKSILHEKSLQGLLTKGKVSIKYLFNKK